MQMCVTHQQSLSTDNQVDLWSMTFKYTRTVFLFTKQVSYQTLFLVLSSPRPKYIMSISPLPVNIQCHACY